MVWVVGGGSGFEGGLGFVDPWRRLGVSVVGLGSVGEILGVAGADFEVRLAGVGVLDDSGLVVVDGGGVPLRVDDFRVTVRVGGGVVEPLGVVGPRYEVVQNWEVVERALGVVGVSLGEGFVDSCGVLRGGRRFFVLVGLGGVCVDRLGVADWVDRFLVVSSGHDGVWPVRYSNVDVRSVCSNTVLLGLGGVRRVFTARHTRNVGLALEDARVVFGLSREWGVRFVEEAEFLLGVRVSGGGVDRVLSGLFPVGAGESDRQRRNRDGVVELVRSIYEGERCVGRVGENGWALYNAVVEYLDHWRVGSVEERALVSMDDGSWVSRLKLRAHALVAGLV